jgi:hypothetical protein
VENGLLEEFPQQISKSGNEKIIYKITPKGFTPVQIYDEMSSLVALGEIS